MSAGRARKLHVLNLATSTRAIAYDIRGAPLDEEPGLLSIIASLCKAGGAAAVDTATVCTAASKARAAFQVSLDLSRVFLLASEQVSHAVTATAEQHKSPPILPPFPSSQHFTETIAG